MDGFCYAGLNEQNFTIGEAIDIIEEMDNLDVSVTGPQFENMVRDVQAYIKSNEVIQYELLDNRNHFRLIRL